MPSFPAKILSRGGRENGIPDVGRTSRDGHATNTRRARFVHTELPSPLLLFILQLSSYLKLVSSDAACKFSLHFILLALLLPFAEQTPRLHYYLIVMSGTSFVRAPKENFQIFRSIVFNSGRYRLLYLENYIIP